MQSLINHVYQLHYKYRVSLNHLVLVNLKEEKKSIDIFVDRDSKEKNTCNNIIIKPHEK